MLGKSLHSRLCEVHLKMSTIAKCKKQPFAQASLLYGGEGGSNAVFINKSSVFTFRVLFGQKFHIYSTAKSKFLYPFDFNLCDDWFSTLCFRLVNIQIQVWYCMTCRQVLWIIHQHWLKGTLHLLPAVDCQKHMCIHSCAANCFTGYIQYWWEEISHEWTNCTLCWSSKWLWFEKIQKVK